MLFIRYLKEHRKKNYLFLIVSVFVNLIAMNQRFMHLIYCLSLYMYFGISSSGQIWTLRMSDFIFLLIF